jgi:AraC family transcriptional regulator
MYWTILRSPSADRRMNKLKLGRAPFDRSSSGWRVEELACGGSAIASLAGVAAGSRVPSHGHDNALFQLTVLGGYRDNGDGGEALVEGPAAVFFPAGSAHEFAVGPAGLATVVIEFDGAWLGRILGLRPAGPLRHWTGGDIAAEASRLTRQWLAAEGPISRRFALTESLLVRALRAPAQRPRPYWLEVVEEELAAERAPRTEALARRAGVSAPWLARAYRHWRGEGIGEARRRRCIEVAAVLLATEPTGLADIAAAAGFCDQSHMTRAFKQQLGRTPAAIRSARLGLAASAAVAL